MDLKERINQIFPPVSEVPVEIDLPESLEQRQYLVNGELRGWDGPMQEVYSPIYLKGPGGISRKFLGRYPLLGEAEALQVLEAALHSGDGTADGSGDGVTAVAA